MLLAVAQNNKGNGERLGVDFSLVLCAVGIDGKPFGLDNGQGLGTPVFKKIIRSPVLGWLFRGNLRLVGNIPTRPLKAFIDYHSGIRFGHHGGTIIHQVAYNLLPSSEYFGQNSITPDPNLFLPRLCCF